MEDAAVEDTASGRRRRRFFRVRVAVLLVVLFVVVLYAIRDLRSRRARNAWERTLDVAVVIVHVDGRTPSDREAFGALQERVSALEARLESEAARHGRTLKPFRFRVFEPVVAATSPPLGAAEGALDLARQTVDVKRWLGELDPRAGVVPEHWDTRIYVTARKPASEVRSFVEGQSEQDGRVGFVDVELDAAMIDLTLFVVAHELMHTLGASDKYDPAGRSRAPDGLAEPERSPLYPQRFAEVMAHGRPTSPTAEAVPESLDELAIGAMTAREIGWLR